MSQHGGAAESQSYYPGNNAMVPGGGLSKYASSGGGPVIQHQQQVLAAAAAAAASQQYFPVTGYMSYPVTLPAQNHNGTLNSLYMSQQQQHPGVAGMRPSLALQSAAGRSPPAYPSQNDVGPVPAELGQGGGSYYSSQVNYGKRPQQQWQSTRGCPLSCYRYRWCCSVLFLSAKAAATVGTCL